MGRLCSICCHPQRQAIDFALARHGDGYRAISTRYAVTKASLQRHEQAHLRQSFALVKEVNGMISAEHLLAKLASLDEQTLEMLADARAHDDLRTALVAVRESRSNVEAYARLGVVGELEARVARLENGEANADAGDD